MPTVYHMVHYRRFDPGGAGLQGGTLEGLCRSALGHVDASGVTLWERIQDRFHDLVDVAERQVLLNKVVDLSSAVFGEMCLFEIICKQRMIFIVKSCFLLSGFP